MQLSIYTIRKTIYQGQTNRVTMPTVMGEITVLDNHEPYVTLLRPGSVQYTHPTAHGASVIDKESNIEIKGGILEVRPNNEVRILADE